MRQRISLIIPWCAWLCLTALVLSLAACGKKGPVQPHSVASPVAAPAFSAVQMGEGIVLTWQRPGLNQDGTPLIDLSGFRIERAHYAPDDPCPECREAEAVLIADLDLDYFPAGGLQDDQLFWTDNRITPGRGYFYRLIAVNRAGRAGQAAHLHLRTGIPPEPPAQIRAEGHDRLVRLSWSPVESVSPEQELLGYLVYRRRGQAPFSPAPLSSIALRDSQFEDFSVENGTTYHYAVRTLVQTADMQIYSMLSPQISVVPITGR